MSVLLNYLSLQASYHSISGIGLSSLFIFLYYVEILERGLAFFKKVLKFFLLMKRKETKGLFGLT